MSARSTGQSTQKNVVNGYQELPYPDLVPFHEQQAHLHSSSWRPNPLPTHHVTDDRDEHIDQGDIYQGFTPAYPYDYSYASAPYFKDVQLQHDFHTHDLQMTARYEGGEWMPEQNLPQQEWFQNVQHQQYVPQFTQSLDSHAPAQDQQYVPQPTDQFTDFATAQNQQYVPQPTQPSNGLLFTSFAHATTTIVARGWRSPFPDTTIPATDLQRQHIVLRLITAISDTANICDAPGGRNFQKRWVAPAPGTSAFYQDTDKEQIAWNILSLAESLHVCGPSVFTSFDAVFWRQTTGTRDYTFAQRMDKIVELLSMSKARCEKLLAGMGLQSVVGHPAYLIRMAKGNARQNNKRQELLEAGRAAEKGEV